MKKRHPSSTPRQLFGSGYVKRIRKNLGKMDSEIPTFLQDDDRSDLVLSINWIQHRFKFDNSFVARLVRLPEADFVTWKASNRGLSDQSIDELRRFRNLVVYLLDIMNFNVERALEVFDQRVPEPAPSVQGFFPPWAGTTLRQYLETNGENALSLADDWFGAIGTFN